MQQIEPGSYISQRSYAQAEREWKQIRKSAKKMLETPGAARAFLLKHGFITRDNKVGKRYR